MQLFFRGYFRFQLYTLLFIGSIIMMFNSYNSVAAEWSVTPMVGFGGEYNDNISLTTADSDAVTGSSITPEVKFNRTNPNSQTSIGTRFKFVQYDNEDIRENDVQFLTLRSRYKTQRSIWRLNGVLKRDTTFTTLEEDILVDEDVTQDLDTDNGLVEVSIRRNRLRLDPSWQYDLTERSSLRVRYRLLDVFYSDAEATNLIDYKRHTLGTTFSRRLSNNDSLGITGEVSKYSAPDNDRETDNYSVNAGYTHKFEKEVKGNIAFGYRTTKDATDNDANDSTGVVLDIGIKKRQSELTSYDISVKRDISASGFGRVVQSDQIDVRVKSRLSPRLSATLRARAFDNETLEGDITSDDRVYYSIEPGLQWMFSRDWAIDGSYRYRKQERDLDSDAAESNAVYISINYTWPKIAVSR